MSHNGTDPHAGDPLVVGLASCAIAEQEVIVRLDRLDGVAHICSCWPDMTRKLAKRYGPPERVSTHKGKVTSAWWRVPIRLIRFGLLATAAQRKAARASIQKARLSLESPAAPRGSST